MFAKVTGPLHCSSSEEMVISGVAMPSSMQPKIANK
jgi:hypothetical protein